MPTWNAEKFLADSVQSVLSQSLEDLELLVIDGGSTDRTLQVLSGFSDRRLRVLSAPGPGIVPALNFGIEQSRAEWIARQDADDISHPERLKTQWSVLSGDSGAVFSHTDVELVGEGAESIRPSRFPRTQALLGLRLCFQCCVVHSTVMFKRKTVLGLDGYRGDHAEDYDLWGRLVEAGRCVGVPEKLLKFRLHPVSLSSRNRAPMQVTAQDIGIEHCRRFMRLTPAEARRAHSALPSHHESRRVREWLWFLAYCAPRLRWKSLELYSWLALQTVKVLQK